MVGEYDLSSIMHYRLNAFAMDKSLPTITLIESASDTNPAFIGKRSDLSPGDIATINAMYPIPSRKKQKIERSFQSTSSINQEELRDFVFQSLPNDFHVEIADLKKYSCTSKKLGKNLAAECEFRLNSKPFSLKAMVALQGNFRPSYLIFIRKIRSVKKARG